MLYIVYRITNNLSKRQYIGAHKTCNINDGYMGSGVLIKQAIKKYGVENFSKEILCEAASSEEMYDKEVELIELHKPEYNLHAGGSGGWDYVNESCKTTKGFQWINENKLNNKAQQNIKGSRTHVERLNSDPEYYKKMEIFFRSPEWRE